MKALFENIFCKHKWNVHVKSPSTRVVNGVFSERKLTFMKEVLICERCGKIKTIEY